MLNFKLEPVCWLAHGPRLLVRFCQEKLLQDHFESSPPLHPTRLAATTAHSVCNYHSPTVTHIHTHLLLFRGWFLQNCKWTQSANLEDIPRDIICECCIQIFNFLISLTVIMCHVGGRWRTPEPLMYGVTLNFPCISQSTTLSAILSLK